MSEPVAVPAAATAPVVQRTAKHVAADYLAISKPRILFLLLIVAWSAMFVAADGLPSWKAFLAVTLGGSFSTAASGAFNNVLEKGRDARMARTSNRPVASGRITRTSAVVYATLMAILSVAVLWIPGYHVAALLTAGAIGYYVIVYTALLKPTTPQNIVIGGLAGSFPALIGWAAQTGGLAWPASAPALVLAALVFVWTPAHFWSLALLYKDDYAAAEYPMMPNVAGEASTRRQIFVYAVATLLTSLLLVATRQASWVYAAGALGLGGVLVARSWRLLVTPNPATYRSYFFFTIQYLGILLVALMVDRVVPLPDLPF